jgi:NAD(P)-dependent dehydrogenase (short-subunit alcohol dehydrogenase family)
MSHVVLITGCSSGIGRDLALRLGQAGYQVVATARKEETLRDLPAALCLPLDVSQPESIQQAVDRTIERFGRIDVLVNNAGYSVAGAVEEVSVEKVEQMFATNVFGVMRMVQAVAPLMRAQKSGRIINISSIVGKLTTPLNGAYSASKFALEGLSNALRMELLPFGVQVVLVEPGSIKTHFHDTLQANTQALMDNLLSPYSAMYRQNQQTTENLRRNEPGPEVVSRVIQRAIEDPRPKARYLAGVGFSGWLVMHLGDSAWDLVVRQMFNIKEQVK